jgi:hypothetical protein
MGIVLVATEQAALHVLDGSDPTYPEELAVVPVDSDPNSWLPPVLALEWPMATLCAVGAGCPVIDVSNPRHPSITGSYPAPFWVEAIAADDDRMVLSESTWAHSVVAWPEALTVLSTSACLGREDRRTPR